MNRLARYQPGRWGQQMFSSSVIQIQYQQAAMKFLSNSCLDIGHGFLTAAGMCKCMLRHLGNMRNVCNQRPAWREFQAKI